MKLVSLLSAAALLASATVASANSFDTYVVNFTHNEAAESSVLDNAINAALAQAGVNAESVTIDMSTAAKWEASAHVAFDRDIVPVFNKWVGLPGFAAIVDARSKRVVGCVNSKFTADEIAQEVRRHTLMAAGRAVKTDASTFQKTTQCPPAHNK